jgi:hypothetical protein
MKPLLIKSSDPWVLLSLATASFRGSCSLRGLIAAGDYINHAVLKRPEIEGGINRLAAAGLVVVSPWGFSLTPGARRLLLGLESDTRSLLKQWDLLNVRLPKLRTLERPFPRWRLGRERYRKAVAEYLSSFASGSKPGKRPRPLRRDRPA